MLICIEQVICKYLFTKMCYVGMCFTFFLVYEVLILSFFNVGNLIYYCIYSYCRCVKYYIMWTVYNAGYVFPAFVSKWTIIRPCSLYSVILFAANYLQHCLCHVNICLDSSQSLYMTNTKCIHSFIQSWFGHFQKVIMIRLFSTITYAYCFPFHFNCCMCIQP